MRAASTYINRFKRVPKYYAHGIYRQLTDKDIFLWAQAIAFKVLITIVPVIILATGVLGQVLRRENAFETVRDYLQDFLPPYRSENLLSFLQQFTDASGTLTIVGVLGLLFSATILLTTLRVAVGNVFQEDWHEGRTILGGYLFDIRMVGQVGLFFLLTFGLTLFMRWLDGSGFEFIQDIGLDYVWLRQGWRRTFKTLGLLIPFLLTTAMFFQLMFFVPKPHPPKRSALLGALTTAVLWEFAKQGFAFYATHVGRFDYGSDDGANAIGDTFGLIIAFVFWVYYSGIVLLLGAVVALLHEKAHRSRRQAALKQQKEPRPAPEASRTGATDTPERSAEPNGLPRGAPTASPQAAPSVTPEDWPVR